MITEERLKRLEKSCNQEISKKGTGRRLNPNTLLLLISTIRTLRAENEGLKAAWELVKKWSARLPETDTTIIQLERQHLINQAKAIIEGAKP